MTTAVLEHQALFDLARLGIESPFKKRYDNFIGGRFVPPVNGEYFLNVSPVVGEPFTEVARSTAEDVEKALDAAHAAKDAWGRTSTTERANILNKIADRMEAKLGVLALAETIDNGKPLSLLRGRDSRARRRHQSDRRDDGRVPLPRTARCRRADHPVELPDPHGRVEARARSRRRQLRRAQARGTNAGIDPRTRRDDR
jgi:hypothetical protein